ncbi:MAG TPA: hypothetical protein VGN51_20350 [Acidimicrobiia bacterium]
MPPDEPERSELDEALFSSTELDHTPTRGARPHEPHEDLSKLDAELFGEFGQGAAGDAAEIPPDGPRRRGRGRRFGLGALIVLLVVGLGGLAYAAFGSDDTPPKAKVDVRGSEVTRATRRTTTTSSTTTTSTTSTTTTTTTTAPPATTRAPVVVPETDPPFEPPPETDPPPPPTEPPTTTPPTTTTM